MKNYLLLLFCLILSISVYSQTTKSCVNTVCKKSIDVNSKFCPYCGKEQTITIKCSNCGNTSVPASATFCNKCSKSLKSSSMVYGSFTDTRDKRKYKTVIIGGQTWLAENFAFKPSSGNYWAINGNDINIAKFGYLYDWNTANAIAPEGWHLPSIEEWEILIKALGGNEIAGGKMKGLNGWESPNTGATNESGFGAVAAGEREPVYGTYDEIGSKAAFWSSSSTGKKGAIPCYLLSTSSVIGIQPIYRDYGMSVRLVKD